MMFSMNRNFDLVCLGRVGVDLNPDEFNKPMEEVGTYHISVGGSPANIAVGAAKLGLNVGFIGKVSDDPMGRYVLNEMRKYGIDTSQIKQEKNALTSLAITEVKSAEDCSVLFYRENVADLKLCCDEIEEEYIADSKALLISGTALSQSPSREAVYVAVDYARKHGTTVIFEIDYRACNWTYLEETSHCYDLLCKQSDIIIGTREEFNVVEYLYDRENADDAASAQRWFKHNAKYVLVKRGVKGFKVFRNDGMVFNGRVYPAKVKKTFGAGDALASAFVSYLLKGLPIEEAIDNGAISAAITISGTDCTKSTPTNADIIEYRRNITTAE